MSLNNVANNAVAREVVREALKSLESSPLETGAQGLLKALGYSSDKTTDLGRRPDAFLKSVEMFNGGCGPINRDKVRYDRWSECAFLFQITNDEIPALASGQRILQTDTSFARGQIESFVFLAIELDGRPWSRTDMAAITRELNRRFPMPAIVIFRHGACMSLAVIDRRVNLRDPSRDVIDSRITVVKDVQLSSPHRAHVDILIDLSLQRLGERRRPSNFGELYKAWLETLSIQALNKRFYSELAWWYFWAVKQVEFPLGGGKDASKRNSVAVIRMLTRLIFVWFIKENRLVPEALFEPDKLREILKTDPTSEPEEGNYYLAILQNLFFATLNVEMGDDRKWAGTGTGMKGDRLIHTLYRHKELFRKPEAALECFAKIPFLNGGLFECLDRELTDLDFQRAPELQELATKEGNGYVLRVDGFSRRKDAQAHVPNKVFFADQRAMDLNEDLGTKGKPYYVQGLLNIFARYKFTVDENTPLEEEVALDPELLGKVFENLLASFNPDTQTTARKLSGSFYTPREVVDYMVDEALVAYLGQYTPQSANSDEKLRHLLSYTTDLRGFSQEETTALIGAIERMRVLDPACGSGAFLMGMLTKLVHVLKKLDPKNSCWRAQNRAPLNDQRLAAIKIADPGLREEKTEDADAALAKFDRDFANSRHADYTRKLYLIEKCIHGVDIQPIAVQIAKLRFFISLVVSQEVDGDAPNFGITALPNLETKIVAADTLTSIVPPGQIELRSELVSEKEKELSDANERYFGARSTKTKRKWRDAIFKLRDELAVLLEDDAFLSPGTARKLVHWNPFDQNASAEFFDPEWMFQLTGGFDVVLGNPPYVRQEEIKHLKEAFKAYYQCYTGTADLYVYFYERSVRLLKPGGVFAFITSNKWYRAKYGEKLRDWMNRNTRLMRIIDFGDEAVFDAIAYPTIVIATSRAVEVERAAPGEQVLALNWTPGPDVETFPAVFVAESFPIPQGELHKGGWQLEPPLRRRLLERIRVAGTPLGEYVKGRFYYGIKTGLNDAFVIPGAIRTKLIGEDPQSAEIIKPFLRGRDIKRWRVEPKDLWLIFTRHGIDIHAYPAIHSHLKQFKKQLMPKPDNWDEEKDGHWPGRKPGSYEWYEIQDNIAYWKEFREPKIVFPDIAISPQFAWDQSGFYTANTAYIVPSIKKHALAVLNSSVCTWFYAQISPQIQNGYFRFIAQYVEQIPMPYIAQEQENILNLSIDAVVYTGDPRFERLINCLVYELFFPEDLHQAGIRLFDAVGATGLARLATLKGRALGKAAEELAATIFSNNHPIYGMLFNLQGLDVVRIIEGKE